MFAAAIPGALATTASKAPLVPDSGGTIRHLPAVDRVNSTAPGGRPAFHMYAPPVLAAGITPSTSQRDQHVQDVDELSRPALGYPSTPTATTDIEVVPPSLDAPRLLTNAEPAKKTDSGDLNALLPNCLRRRSVLSRHEVGPEQVDQELAMQHETKSHGLVGELAVLKKETEKKRATRGIASKS